MSEVKTIIDSINKLKTKLAQRTAVELLTEDMSPHMFKDMAEFVVS